MLLDDLKTKMNRMAKAASFARYLHSGCHMFLVLQGWGRARYILRLGSLELRWIKKTCPWWEHQLRYYLGCAVTR